MSKLNRWSEMMFRKQKGDFSGCMSVCLLEGSQTECYNYCKNKAPLSEVTSKKLLGTYEEWDVEDYWDVKAVTGEAPTPAQIVAHKPREMRENDKAAGLGRSKIGSVAHLPIVLVAIAVGVLIYWLGRE